MSRAIEWVEDNQALEKVVGAVGAGPLAVDTEADSFHRYRDKICLIQLSFSGRDVLVDPLGELDPAPFGKLLATAEIRKIFHGADYDLRLLDRDYHFRVRGLFDTMVAARLTGERSFGLASLVDSNFGFQLEKKHQLADWARRPLPDDLTSYAAADTRYLADLARRLEDRLKELGRETWAEEEFRRLEGVRWAAQEENAEAFRRVKGSGTLDRRGLGVLRALYRWRDDQARSRDVPPFRVMGDAVVLELAKRPPSRPADLSRVRGMPARLRRPGLMKEIVEEISRVMSTSADQWPEVRKGKQRRVPAELRSQVAKLQHVRDRVACELDLEPAFLASRAALETVAARMGAGEEWTSSPGLGGWRARVLGPAIAAS